MLSAAKHLAAPSSQILRFAQDDSGRSLSLMSSGGPLWSPAVPFHLVPLPMRPRPMRPRISRNSFTFLPEFLGDCYIL
jgi:hypothetical protein